MQNVSHPLLDYIEWQVTSNNNLQVLNDTIDYYRYFDATRQAEFLYEMVKDTVERFIPEEVQYLQQYDEFKQFIDAHFDMPDSTISQLIRFLEQNQGPLSKRARNKEFKALSEKEVSTIESAYQEVFRTIAY